MASTLHAVMVAQMAASAGPAVLLLMCAVVTGGKAGLRAFCARDGGVQRGRRQRQVSVERIQETPTHGELVPKVWPRVFLLLSSGVWTGAQALRVSLLWRSSADGTIDFENASSQFQKLACRMYVIVAYGIAGPATMLLLLALIRIALAVNDSGSSARGYVAGTLAFMLPVAAAQALITYIDTTPAFGDTRDQMLRGLPTYFIDVYISNARPGRMTDANAQCSWGEHRYYPLAGEACVACIVPLFATIVAAISITVYMVCMATLTSHVESSVINYRLRSRVNRLQRTAFVGLVSVVGTGGASLLFKPGTLVYESVMLAHIFGVLCSCAASVWLLWPQQKSADIILSVVMGSDDDNDSDGSGHDGNATDREAMESARGSGCHADGGGDGTDIGRAASDGSSADNRL